MPVLGLGLSLFLSRWLESLLFEVAPADPLTLVSVTVLLLTVALVGSYWPAERATRVDPLETLRCE
jgi:ABC-type lipoprotein release transport system permease subunit